MGGAGFIGDHLAEMLTGKGHGVVALDNFEPYYDLDIEEHNVAAASWAVDERWHERGGTIRRSGTRNCSMGRAGYL